MAQLPPARSDVVDQQDGLHNVLTSPQFRYALIDAVSGYLGQIFEPTLIEMLRRFLAKGRRNDSRSFAVDFTGNVPIKVLERDEYRIRAYFYNKGPNIIYLGGRQVTTGALNDPNGGIPLPVNPVTPFVLEGNVGELFAIAETAKSDLRILDVSGA